MKSIGIHEVGASLTNQLTCRDCPKRFKTGLFDMVVPRMAKAPIAQKKQSSDHCERHLGSSLQSTLELTIGVNFFVLHQANYCVVVFRGGKIEDIAALMCSRG